jgi:hypothetical protein
MNKIIKTGLIYFSIIIVLAITISAYVNSTKSNYMGAIFEDKTNMQNDELKFGFETISECEKWAQDEAGKRDFDEANWRYVCGTGCEKFSNEGGLSSYTCEEIVSSND